MLAPLGGVVADHVNRRKVVIATQVSSMVLASRLAFLTLTNRITVIEVILLASLMGVVNAFDILARQAFLVEMVGREDLMNAIALNPRCSMARRDRAFHRRLARGEYRRGLVLFSPTRSATLP